ncbi:MAG: hypothetical protein FWG54_06325, partial [Bacteroidetes bacterium]|nr:hypothetical protein [Bacteroidota bacterium]
MNKKAKTLLQHIEQIIEYAEKSKLSEAFYQKAQPYINFVAKTMNLTSNQALIFSLFMEKSHDNSILISDLTGFLECRDIKSVCMINDVEALEARRLVRCCREKRRKPTYRVPLEVIDAVKQDIVYKPEDTKNLTTSELFNRFEQLFEERSNNEIPYFALIQELRILVNDNASLCFCQQMKEYEKICDDDHNFLLLILFCHLFINEDDDNIYTGQFEYLFDSKIRFKKIVTSMQNGDHIWISHNILEYGMDEGFADKNRYRLSSSAKEKLFAEINLKIHQAENKKGMLLHQNIVPKQLYYNKREEEQIARLS